MGRVGLGIDALVDGRAELLRKILVMQTRIAPGESSDLCREQIAALKALADDGKLPAARVDEALEKYAIDRAKPAPWTV